VLDIIAAGRADEGEEGLVSVEESELLVFFDGEEADAALDVVGNEVELFGSRLFCGDVAERDEDKGLSKPREFAAVDTEIGQTSVFTDDTAFGREFRPFVPERDECVPYIVQVIGKGYFFRGCFQDGNEFFGSIPDQGEACGVAEENLMGCRINGDVAIGQLIQEHLKLLRRFIHRFPPFQGKRIYSIVL